MTKAKRERPQNGNLAREVTRQPDHARARTLDVEQNNFLVVLTPPNLRLYIYIYMCRKRERERERARERDALYNAVAEVQKICSVNQYV